MKDGEILCGMSDKVTGSTNTTIPVEAKIQVSLKPEIIFPTSNPEMPQQLHDLYWCFDNANTNHHSSEVITTCRLHNDSLIESFHRGKTDAKTEPKK